MIACERFEELLSAYLDGEITPEERSKVETHLQTCENCQQDLKSLEKVRVILKNLKPVEAPTWLWLQIQQKIAKHKVVFLVHQTLRGLALSAAAVLLFVSSVTLLGYFSPDPVATSESSMYFGSHAYHLIHQPLADRSSWSFIIGKSNFEVIASEE